MRAFPVLSFFVLVSSGSLLAHNSQGEWSDDPYVRVARGGLGINDFATLKPIEYNPNANNKLITAVAFDKEDEAIWAFKHGATAEGALAECVSYKDVFEGNLGQGICDKVAQRFGAMMERNKAHRKVLISVCAKIAGYAAIAALVGATGLIVVCQSGRWVVNKLKAA